MYTCDGVYIYIKWTVRHLQWIAIGPCGISAADALRTAWMKFKNGSVVSGTP